MAKNNNFPKKEHKDVHQAVTDQIIASLESGVMPWKRPWNAGKLVGSESFLPRNAVTGRPYQGINLLILLGKGHEDPRWCTLETANSQGWRIRTGEKSTTIVRSSPQLWTKTVLERDPETGEEKSVEKTYQYWFTREYRVFNASQIEGIPPLDEVKTPRTQTEIDNGIKEILSHFPQIRLTHLPVQADRKGNDAFYRNSDDSVTMPSPERFSDINAYYGVLLHEYGHSTGHPDRLNRESLAKYHTSDRWRAKEELVAELASAFVTAELGLPDDLTRNTAYIGSWLEELKKDKREIFRAASMAQKAADLLMGRDQDLSLRENEEQELHREFFPEDNLPGLPDLPREEPKSTFEPAL